MKFLIWLAVLPSIVIGILIYRADQVEQEPKKELVKALLMGLLSVIITVLLSWIMGITKIKIENLNTIEILFYSFIGVALIEEFSKWLCTKLFISHNKNYNYLFDGIVYAVFVSLGFATIENILYTANGGVITGLIRGIVTVPSHAFYAIFMGYYISKTKEAKIEGRKKEKFQYTIYSLLLPVLFHGTFDALLLMQNPILLLIFLIFVIFLYIVSIKKVNQLQKQERLFEKKEILFCSECGHKIYGKYCSNCGKKIKQENK